MPFILQFFSIISLLLLSTFPASATSYEEVNLQIEAFEKTGQARFAPASMKRVAAYQGASMLAFEQQKKGGFDTTTTEEETQTKHLNDAIRQTLQALDLAKSNAETFTSTFSPLLTLEIEANKAFVYHHKPQMQPDEGVRNLFEKAQGFMNKAIVSTEKGKLNQARQAAQKAEIYYNKCIDLAMSGLVEQTKHAVSQATSMGAKNYAPRTWSIADAELDLLEDYNRDLQRPSEKREGVQRPAKVGYALEMAIYSQKMAIKVKNWRRNNGSHEKLALTLRKEHLDIAKALDIPLDYEKVGIDIDTQPLVKHIQQLKKTLAKERLLHAEQISTMQNNFDKNLNQKLQEQRLKDQQAFQSKLSNIKSAFSTKLEQETFEAKRQKKVQSLFKSNEVNIIASLDGSLIIRAKAIQFAPNSSKVDSRYYDFLGRIKEALMMYPDRQIKIEGHTDSVGDEKVNRKLSLQRAESVQEFLVVAGIDTDRIRALGFGEVKPIASNMYKKGRAMNRRIDIIIQAPK